MKNLLAVLLLTLPLSVPARADGEIPVDLTVGGKKNLCRTGLVRCPAGSFLCDDPKVAVILNGEHGVEVHGISPGTTLCAVLVGPASAFRQVLRVTVKADAGAPAP